MGMWGLELRVLRVCMAGLGLVKGLWKVIILEFANALNFAVANTWFKKDEGNETEICRTVVDYIRL